MNSPCSFLFLYFSFFFFFQFSISRQSTHHKRSNRMFIIAIVIVGNDLSLLTAGGASLVHNAQFIFYYSLNDLSPASARVLSSGLVWQLCEPQYVCDSTVSLMRPISIKWQIQQSVCVRKWTSRDLGSVQYFIYMWLGLVFYKFLYIIIF